MDGESAQKIDPVLLFEKLIARPDVFVGRRSVELIHVFMEGFCDGAVGSSMESLEPFKSFIELIRLRFKNKTHNWSNIIRFWSTDDHQAVELLRELWSEFRTTGTIRMLN